MAEVANALLDFPQPMNVDLLETTVGVFYGTGTPEQVCMQFQMGCIYRQWQVDHITVPTTVHYTAARQYAAILLQKLYKQDIIMRGVQDCAVPAWRSSLKA